MFQNNQNQWVRDILDGGIEINCHSGEDDDPNAGELNDPKDPFVSEGLNMPWKWVTGNHDVLVQGNFPVASYRDDAVGINADGGTRDWSQAGGPVVQGTVPADPKRSLFDEGELLAFLLETSDGPDGIDQQTVDSGRANYWFDSATLRVIVISTASPTGAATGVFRQEHVDNFLRGALDDAEADGQWVIIASHHGSTSLADGTGLGGTLVDDALTPTQFEDLLGEYPNVLAHFAAHSHVHRVRAITPSTGHAYWQVHTSALIDYPYQMRRVAVTDEDNGFVSITGVAVNFSVEGDEMANEGRVHALIDHTSGWGEGGYGEVTDRNVRLWITKPSEG